MSSGGKDGLESPLLYSLLFDGNGGASDATSGDGLLWSHLNYSKPQARKWLREKSSLPPSIVNLLQAEETRPRAYADDDALVVVLRGVNTNPGEEPHDMVSVRACMTESRIITTRSRRIFSVMDIHDALRAGKGPRSSGDFLATLVARLADRIGDFVNFIEERVDDAEVALADGTTVELRREVNELRSKIATVRRFLAPQRDAIDRLCRQPVSWIGDQQLQILREEADRLTRYLEDLDLARERAILLREEFLATVAQEQNSRMYVLSIVAAIFLPLTFVTGLLGMNVGGLPGLENPSGFAISVFVMIAASIVVVAYFRWRKWL